VQQGFHTALLVGVTLSQGPRSRIPVRTQATPRQSLRVRGVRPHDWTSRATLLSPQTATSVQPGAASSPRQALLQVYSGGWTTDVVGWVAVRAALARLDVYNSTARRYLVYSHLNRPVMINSVPYCMRDCRHWQIQEWQL